MRIEPQCLTNEKCQEERRENGVTNSDSEYTREENSKGDVEKSAGACARPQVGDPGEGRERHERKSYGQSVNAGRWMKEGAFHPDAEVSSQKEKGYGKRANRGDEESGPCQSWGFGVRRHFWQSLTRNSASVGQFGRRARFALAAHGWLAS